MRLPTPVRDLMTRQHGVASRRQLVPLMSTGQIDNHLRRGAFVAVERGVYGVQAGARPAEQAAMAAVLRAEPHAVLTGPFVLGLLGVDGFSVKDPFEVLTAPGRRLRSVTFSHRRDPTPSALRASFGCLPIVPAVAALIDAARHADVDDRRLRVAIDQVRWKHQVSAERLRARAELLGPCDPGAARMLALDTSRGLTPESEGERRLGAMLRAFEPAPEPQIRILNFRLDWYWRLYRVGVEYQGWIDHSSAADRESDAARTLRLGDVGVRILTVAHEDLADESALIGWIAAELRRRAAELGVQPPAVRPRR